MKKLIAVSAVAALAATALSAEVTFGAWGRALWVTAANAYSKAEDKSVIVSDVHQSWAENAPRVGLNVSGNSENVGFTVDYHANGTKDGSNFPGDNCLIWVKPIEWLKVSVGQHDQNVLRGDACFGLWNWDRIGVVSRAGVEDQEGWTFHDYLDAGGTGSQGGVSIVATPVEGLTIGAGIPLKLTNADGKWNNGADVEYGKASGRTLEDVYAHGTAYVGAYAIDGIGTIKAALKTLPKASDDKSQTEIAAAFDLTAVENLFVSLGARINTHKETAKIVNAYARYGINEALTIHAIVGTKISAADAKEGKADGAFGFLFGAGVDYNLDGGIGLFADVRYANGIFCKGTSADNSDCLTLGAGVTKGFSNGLIGVAFEGATNSQGRYLEKDEKQFSWEIPVRFEYWF